MKTVEIVETATGWYVTRRYCGRNKGAEFFPFGVKRAEKKANAEAKDKYIKDWMGE
jgi:hypothetical protein